MALYHDSIKPKPVKGYDLGKETERTPSIPTPNYQIAWGREPYKECNKKAWAKKTKLWRDGHTQFEMEDKHKALRWWEGLELRKKRTVADMVGVPYHKIESKDIIDIYRISQRNENNAK